MDYLTIIMLLGALTLYVVLRVMDRAARVDAVCGMDARVDAPYQSVYHGRRYRFCTDSRRRKFEAEPRRWLAGGAPTSE